MYYKHPVKMDPDEKDPTLEIVESETTCAICYAEFLEPEDLKLHVEQLHLTEVSKQRYCQFCSSIFNSLENYAYHIRDAHLTSIKCCKYCCRAFTDEIAYRKHESKHYMHGKNVCSQCKKQFTHVYEIEMHEVKYHKDVDDGVMLHDVYTLLTSVLNMKATLVLQDNKPESYSCHQCNYTNSDLTKYIAHLQKKGCRIIVCNGCSNLYKDKKGLLYHFRQNRLCKDYLTEKNKMQKCKLCQKDFEFSTLKIHKQYCKPVKCNTCNIVFETLDQFSRHQSTEHPLAVSLMSCDFCHKEFVGNVSLQKHIARVHSSDFHLYKYTCIYCERLNLYKHPKELFAHFYTKHANLQPYSCKICDKSFRVRKKFTIHIKLDHKSVGFVEFDSNYNVFFTANKSENPFQPHCLIDESLIKSVNEKEQIKGDLVDNMETTDQETDVEKIEKMPAKMRLKNQSKSNVKSVTMESDFMQSATEGEGNQTECNDEENQTEEKTNQPLLLERKRKVKTRSNIKKKKPKYDDSDMDMEIEFLESDDEPLIAIKKKTKAPYRPNYEKKKFTSNLLQRNNKNSLTCKICKKYCYTVQNYNHHVSTHSKNESKKCIKCSKTFNSNNELDKHMKNDHGSSRLTDTLRSLLDRRRLGSDAAPKVSRAELFQRTIKKYKKDYSYKGGAATITELQENSVKSFIETFVPDESKKQDIKVENSITIKQVHGLVKAPAIKLKKFVPKPEMKTGKLKMPVRYKQHGYFDAPKVNINLVSFTNEEQSYNTYDDTYDYEDDAYEPRNNMTVPEVAQEVMLENTEEHRATKTIIPHKLVLPKLPMQSKEQIRIAHLLPQAPYYKIVKVGDLMDKNKKPEVENETAEKEEITLPSGTKLVNVNPLAHLLGETSVEKLPGLIRSKYYKPKTVNFQNAIAKAMLQLSTPKPKKKKVPNNPPAMEVEQ